jgi:hypothetical protein
MIQKDTQSFNLLSGKGSIPGPENQWWDTQRSSDSEMVEIILLATKKFFSSQQK